MIILSAKWQRLYSYRAKNKTMAHRYTRIYSTLHAPTTEAKRQTGVFFFVDFSQIIFSFQFLNYFLNNFLFTSDFSSSLNSRQFVSAVYTQHKLSLDYQFFFFFQSNYFVKIHKKSNCYFFSFSIS